VRVWQASVLNDMACDKPPGYILQTSPQGIDVATGKGVLRLQQLQLPGKRAMSVAELLNAYAAEFSVTTILG
jgi:methionyl-tRNA formyltransferase